MTLRILCALIGVGLMVAAVAAVREGERIYGRVYVLLAIVYLANAIFGWID